MSLNIKSQEAHRLAQELAAITGESMTTAVTEAVRERLKRLKSKDIKRRIHEIRREFAKHLKDKGLPDHGELLYDERGLPK